MTTKEVKQIKIAAYLTTIGVAANALNRMPLQGVIIALAYAAFIFVPLATVLNKCKKQIDALPKSIIYLVFGLSVVLWRVLRAHPIAEATCAFVASFTVYATAFIYDERLAEKPAKQEMP
ncbi:hypothetical protein GEOBRER4_n0379 [Citrifermentans bremense]|uniref:Uncharacterized protein n=1 Tax=Citrifermentans bremense TaxID=60035 RepID=A0A6S6M1M3_9BACT|nr:hypothetical protein [Citrifermentans bremense]BCG45621.1 hypothetical protein GEOBRER4_n0379 [Citrifermentans bremense]